VCVSLLFCHTLCSFCLYSVLPLRRFDGETKGRAQWTETNIQHDVIWKLYQWGWPRLPYHTSTLYNKVICGRALTRKWEKVVHYCCLRIQKRTTSDRIFSSFRVLFTLCGRQFFKEPLVNRYCWWLIGLSVGSLPIQTRTTKFCLYLMESMEVYWDLIPCKGNILFSTENWVILALLKVYARMTCTTLLLKRAMKTAILLCCKPTNSCNSVY
jgi:hypothetical protein